MLNLDPAKLLVILTVALVVLGPERLPKVARQMAAVWRELSRIRDQVTDDIRSAMPDIDLPKIPRVPSASGAISGFIGSITQPPSTGRGSTSSAVSGSETGALPDEGSVLGRTAPGLIVHPTLGEVAFVPDDPDMN